MGASRVLLRAALGLVVATAATAANAANADGTAPDIEPRGPRDARAPRLGIFAAVGSLASPGACGAAFLTGLRLGLDRHFAGSFDVGYGLLGAPSTTQDRWWVMPAAAWVIPVGGLQLDLGAGAGVGTSSGYTSWSDYTARPFTPIWHYTVPAARAHVTAVIALSPHLDLFARADLASLLYVGSPAAARDTTWFALWIGVQPRLL